MYEDLEAIAQLKFGKEIESVSARTRESVRNAKAEYAALTRGANIISGQQEASIARLSMECSERLARSLFNIWVALITQRNDYIARADVGFIMPKIEGFTKGEAIKLRRVFRDRPGAIIPMLTEEADRRMYAVAARVRTDLEIMVREHEAFPKKTLPEVVRMEKTSKVRFGPGRRVLVGRQSRPGAVISVADLPGEMGEFRHEIRFDQDGTTSGVMGCDLQAFPGIDEDLQMNRPIINLHVQDSNIANLNLGSQIGTINASLQTISDQGASEHEFAQVLKELTEAVVSQKDLPDPEKQEVVQALSTIAEQATKKPEQRSKVTLKALVSWIPTAISAAKGLSDLWDKFGPIIQAHLGL
jgi:hypothetical protein